MKTLNEWTKKEFKKVPKLDWQITLQDIDSIIIVPKKHIHDSGFRCMEFIACIGEQPVYRISGGSDCIHIDGIGGYGKWNGSFQKLIIPKGWCIDCLRESGYLRIFAKEKIETGTALSSFEIYS